MNAPITTEIERERDKLTDVFDHAPCGMITTDGNGTILSVNAYMAGWLGISPKELRGQTIGSLFIDRGNDTFAGTILEPLKRCGAVRQAPMDLAGKSGHMPAFVNASMREIDDGELPLIDFVFFDMRDRIDFEREQRRLRRNAEELVAIEKASPDAIVTLDCDLVIMTWNNAATRLFGYTREEAVGQRFGDILVDQMEKETEVEFVRAVQAGQTTMYETARMHKDGHRVNVEVHAAPMIAPNGETIGSTHILRDAQPREKAQKHVRTIMEELRHRTKNILSVVQVVARQTADSSTKEEFVRKFSDRLRSLAASQDMLVRSQWQGVELAELIRTQLTHLTLDGEDSFRLTGPDVTVQAKPAEALGMAVFELATNAAKYGAFSIARGRVDISWAISDTDEPFFVLNWEEKFGPPVTPPQRTGFGSVVTGRLIESSTRGKVTCDYVETGVVWSLVAPVDGILETG